MRRPQHENRTVSANAVSFENASIVQQNYEKPISREDNQCKSIIVQLAFTLRGVMMFSDIYVTAPTLEEAKRIAHAMIEEKLGACANMHPIKSLYRWQGNIEEDEEYALLIKTKTALVDEATARIRELHSYETPCIISFTIESGWPPYLDWIREETR